MFIFSNAHNWQDDAAVKQVLVFSNIFMYDSFNHKFVELVQQHGVSYATDSGIGAIYKLRAVKDSAGFWIPVIRCGFTGKFLWEDYPARHTTPEAALAVCKAQLKKLISESF